MPRRIIRGRHNAIKPSAGSKAGVHDVAADNARIRNEGEAAFNFTMAEGNDESWTFQIAAVNKVLCAVSYLVDHRMRVIFDQGEKAGVDTSHIFNKKAGTTTKMKRERNGWTFEAFIDEEDRLSSSVRQG
jgi:intein-encoded DNA endonuclease-like protein